MQMAYLVTNRTIHEIKILGCVAFSNCTMAQSQQTTYCHAIVSGLKEENTPSFFCAFS